MEMFIEALKAFFIGLVEGITEWLPISSTGHMILVDEFVNLEVSPEFLALFLVVIQLGAICAVIVLYFRKLNPFALSKTTKERHDTWRLWGMVVIGCIPAAVIGFAFDDWVNEHLYNAITVSAALIFYGIVFIIIEQRNRKKMAALDSGASSVSSKVSKASKMDPTVAKIAQAKHAKVDYDVVAPGNDGDDSESTLFKIHDVGQIDIKHAFLIGCFQVLAIIPGTSRSGATIIGGMLTGCSRTAAAEFTFFLAIPVMFGWGIVKFVKYLMAVGLAMSSLELEVLIVGIITAFIVSILSIRFLMGYIKRNDFTAFGVYRIILGVCVLAFFMIRGLLGAA